MTALKPPVARSPLSHREPLAADELTLKEVQFATLLILRGDLKSTAKGAKGTLGITIPKPLSSIEKKGVGLHWLGPDTLLLTATETLDEMTVGALIQDFSQIVDVSHQYAAIEFAGGRAREAIQKISTLDLHKSVFGKGRVAQSNFGHANGIVCAKADETFYIFTRRSFADYLWCLLANSGYEFGLPEQKPRDGELMRK